MIRILVVDDSLTIRRRLIEIISGVPDMVVVGEASDGHQAIDLAIALRPDVITLDLALPGMTGFAVTEHVMAHRPTPILIVSASFNRGELHDTYQALAAGAIDVLDKPHADDDTWEPRFISAIRMISRIKVITHPRGRLGALGRTTVTPPVSTATTRTKRLELIALGASTGGPAALAEVIAGIPARDSPPILVVLHIGAPFALAFADWLAGQTNRKVRVARDGDPLEGVLCAPPNQHMTVEGSRVRVIDGPPRHHCIPSVDVLFEALAREHGDRTAAALLTGMGRDGATGLLAIRAAGGSTIAQDEATSIVYGMPREAVICGAAEQVLPLSEIGPALARLAR